MDKQRKYSKVFFIGLGRTGNRSLIRAMSTLGYTTSRNPKTLQDLEDYDVVSDHPVAVVYDFLAWRWPDAAFILNWRNPETWIVSAFNHGRRKRGGPIRRQYHNWKLFGATRIRKETKAQYLQGYIEHNRRVREFFQGRLNFMEINICDNHDGWEKLCSFLDEPIPDMPFPHVGKRTKI